ncbi:Gfo/Idh/MocA family oxidoreductase [Cypionkella sp.]|uniref:Gfo/Idh/MocA family protein n=1 Tax=Cypionkella sp. TaxID=2811411 RepID=UPI0026329341|nr:Gfo/Idh/MocA family oxidoreductase [Cypionkella sp.]MDB5664520.1 oxidoreductase [Cypionkella sp.]
MTDLRQTITPPTRSLPIVIFGAGSIVSDAHLPAYAQAGFTVAGIYDPDHAKAIALAAKHGTIAFANLTDATALGTEALYDLAVPPAAISALLRALPEGCVALIQKPMGSDLAEADEIIRTLRARNIRAAVNFQLRFAPMCLALKDAIAQGQLGDVIDFDALLAVNTPWHLWAFLANLPRVEILLHSVHYLDLIRDLFGNPTGIAARTMGHPSSTVANSRTSMILDYGPQIRASLSINHNHNFGRKFQACEFRISGTKGAAYLKVGANLDYPLGEPDELWLNTTGEWRQIPLVGNWFIAAFVGRITQVMRFATGEDAMLQGSAEDAWHTMALVEAAYESAAAPLHPIRTHPNA